MPNITLDLVSLDNKPLVGLSRRFEGGGGTIGRDEGNTLALPDAQRRVSRLHAAISFPGGVPTITNSSAVLPIGVGGMQLESGQAMPLLPGMNLDIGPYVLAVRQSEAPARPAAAHAAASTSDAYPAPAPAPIAALPNDGDPFADLLAGLGPAAPAAAATMPNGSSNAADDPMARLFGAGAPAAAASVIGPPAVQSDVFAALGTAPAAGGEPQRHFAAPSPLRHPPAAAAIIPEDFNPFDLPSASTRNTADPLSLLSGGSAATMPHALTADEQSIDALFAPGGASMGDVLLDGQGASGSLLGGAANDASSLLAPPESNDPLALFGAPPLSDDRPARPMRDDRAEIGAAFQPPRALDPVLPPAPASHSRPPAAAPVSAAIKPAPVPSYPEDALTRAFLAGANLPPGALPQGLTPEIMAIVGSVIRTATAGAIDVLAVRANIKREVQAHVTIISSEANNPLKFLPDAESVLQQLLGNKMRGFMGPDEAMRDAFNDLRAHELGVMAGTRAALAAVLEKFDPAILGERLIGGSLLEKALPAMRKTKLWDLYLERYAQIRREVEDDFQSVFGKAFVAAYERETERMKTRLPNSGAG
ncbi:MAG: hypothetical protein JWQ33_3036 [Ramlibacter sp.]|nr:hypothetical protein [Ramlibacter sp.]